MSNAASLSLLKGGKKAAVADELDKDVAVEAEAPIEADVVEVAPLSEGDEEDVVIDVDALNGKQVDALVAEHDIEVPADWAKKTLAKKKAWLKEQFEEADEVTDDTAAEAPAEQPAEQTALEPVTTEETVVDDALEKPAKKAGKAVKKAAASGEIELPGQDVLSDLVHEIENLKEKDARAAVTTLNDETEMTMFKLGGVLSVIQANGWFEPYASFRDYVEKEAGMHYRKATYWAAIYNNLAESKVPWEKVKGLGWTKLKEIAEVLTVDNVEEWVKIAGSQTTLQLIETVKSHKQAGATKALEDQVSKTVTTMTFKVHDDQKETVKAAITKAKEDSGTTVDTAALEFICLDFLGGQSMAQKLSKIGLEGALEALEKAFPGTNFSVELPEEA
jgi:hypothetical protein